MNKFLLGALLVSILTIATACDDDANTAKPAVTPPATADAGAAGDAAAQKPADPDATVAEAPKSTSPVANVNGVEITRDAYDAEIAELTKRFAMFGGNMPGSQLARFKKKIIERLVDDELVKQEVTKANVVVTDAEIDVEFNTYKERTPGGAENFEKFLARSGMSADKIKGDIQRRLALKKLVNKDGALDVTDAEAKEYYAKNEKRFQVKERAKARHILIKVDKSADDAAVKEAKKKIDAIYKQAKKKGTNFADLAKEKSEGPSAPRGGDLGWFGKGRMVKEFEEAAFTMTPGQLSMPLKTQFGWHVLKLEERETAGQKKFDEVKDDITQKLEARKFREARNKLLDGLRSGGKVEILEKIEIPASKPASAPGGLKLPPGGKLGGGGPRINPKKIIMPPTPKKDTAAPK
jgi:peptidyl-prolyl cis-trans isomerase C